MEEMSGSPSGRGRWQHRLLQWFWRHLLRRLQLFGILHGWSRALRQGKYGGKSMGKPRGLGGKPMEHPGGTGNLMEKMKRLGKALGSPATVNEGEHGPAYCGPGDRWKRTLLQRYLFDDNAVWAFQREAGRQTHHDSWAPRERWQVVLTKAISWASSYHSVGFTTNSGDAPAT